MLISLANFAGVAPKLAPFMLQPNQAQVASNTRLWTGALEPLTAKLPVKSGLAENIKSIYRFGQDAVSDADYWFAWGTHVSVVKGPISGDLLERTYYTGSGYPKVTNHTVAISSEPYPTVSYRLGIPAPATAPTVSVTSDPILTNDNIAVSVGVGATRVFSVSDFNGGITFDSIVVKGLPAAGTLTLSGIPVTLDQTVTTNDLTSGNLVFTPAAGVRMEAYASFWFRYKSGAYTSVPYSVTISVNNAPTASNSALTIDEDVYTVFTLNSFGYSDVNSDPLHSVVIKSLPTAGTLTLGGIAVIAGQEVLAADISSGLFGFTPTANAYGAPYTSFTYAVSDGVDTSANVYTMTVNVNSVNDAPISADKTVRTRVDSPLTFVKNDFDFSDNDSSDSLQAVEIVTIPDQGLLKLNGTSVAVLQRISVSDISNGLLVYTPTDGAVDTYSTMFTFRISDGISYSPYSYRMNIIANSNAQNSSAMSIGGAIQISGTAPTPIKDTDFNYSDVDGDPFVSVVITSLPAVGTLKLDGVNLVAGGTVSVAKLKAGGLTYTPGASPSGAAYASFVYKFFDGDTYSSLITFYVNVNSKPTGQSTTVTVLESTPKALTVDNFGYSDVDYNKIASVRIVSKPTAGLLTLSNVAVADGDVISANDIYAGKLVFSPAVGVTGDPYTSIKFKVLDAYSESDSTYTMTFTVLEASTNSATVSTSETKETRAYVHTYVSAWGEEGQPSDPTLVDIYPASETAAMIFAPAPLGNYNIATTRVYRTAVGSSGTNYYFVAEMPVATTYYTDKVVGSQLGEPLPSLSWATPPADLQGLTALPNGFLAGFTGKDVYFSEAYYLHAWPVEYSQSVDYPIVALGQFGQSLVVLTTGAPYMLTGSDPASMTLQRLDFDQACVSNRSVARLGSGVVYASPDGLAYIGPDGMNVLTADFFTRKEWQTLNPSSIVGGQHDGRYYAFFDDGVTKGGFILDPKSNGSPFVFTDQYFDGLYNDLRNDALYGVRQGTISKLEGSTSLLGYTWRSKQFLLPKPINFKCAQVLAADYASLSVKFYVDGVLVHTAIPTSQAPFQLPGGYKGRVLEVELTGTSTVVAVHVAESMEELRNV